MAKIRTQDQLQDALDRDLGWRLKEILNLKTGIVRSKGLPQTTFVRAGVALLYAHWEGFIKTAATCYAEYVSTRGLLFRDLKPCFIVLGLRGRLEMLGTSRQTSTSLEVLDFIQNKMNQNAAFNLDKAIDTESNLGSNVLRNILNSLGFDENHYSSYYHLIDESLVRRRNRVAHGEYVDLSPEDWRNLADTIVSLMRAFKTDIQNGATLASYRAV